MSFIKNKKRSNGLDFKSTVMGQHYYRKMLPDLEVAYAELEKAISENSTINLNLSNFLDVLAFELKNANNDALPFYLTRGGETFFERDLPKLTELINRLSTDCDQAEKAEKIKSAFLHMQRINSVNFFYRYIPRLIHELESL